MLAALSARKAKPMASSSLSRRPVIWSASAEVALDKEA
jgi:hypothetical protein